MNIYIPSGYSYVNFKSLKYENDIDSIVGFIDLKIGVSSIRKAMVLFNVDSQFIKSLAEMYASLIGEAYLEINPNYCDFIKLSINETGKVTVIVKISGDNDFDKATSLNFKILIDQTYLPSIIDNFSYLGLLSRKQND